MIFAIDPGNIESAFVIVTDDLSKVINKGKVYNEDLLDCGMCRIGNYWLCAIPTIIVERPKTLVGMGDTISSVSLLAAR